jgi:hypothetical protein
MTKGLKLAAFIVIAGLINKYAVRRFWALPTTTTTTTT